MRHPCPSPSLPAWLVLNRTRINVHKSAFTALFNPHGSVDQCASLDLSAHWLKMSSAQSHAASTIAPFMTKSGTGSSTTKATTTTKTTTATMTTTTTTTAEDMALLRQLDAAADRIRAHISDEPYVLTIPQEEPKFHHYSRYAADTWLINAPFERQEEYSVQYQTFVYRDPYSDLFERIRYSQFARTFQPSLAADTALSRSATTTPKTGPKKKISLAAYKSKQAQGTMSTPSEKAHSRPPPSAVDAAHEKVEDSIKPSRLSNNAEKTKHDPREEVRLQQHLKRKHTDARPEQSPSPTKKPRPSPGPRTHLAPSSGPESPPKDSRAKASGSLSLLGRLSPLDPLYIEGRISPTLPPEIVAALDSKLVHPESTANSAKAREDDRNSHPSASARAAASDAAHRPGSKHDSVLSHSNEAAHANDVAVAASSNHSKPGLGRDVDAKPVPSYVLKLKIPQKLRQDYRRLIRCPPRASRDIKPGPQATAPTHDTSPPPIASPKRPVKQAFKKPTQLDKDEPARGVARKMTAPNRPSPKASHPSLSPNPVPLTKRPHSTSNDSSDLTQPQAKRQKVPPPLPLEKNATTAIQAEFRSPALPSSASKSQQVTPGSARKNRPSVAKRDEPVSSPLSDMPTAQDRTPVAKQPASVSQQPHRTGANTRPSPLSSAAKTPESQAWVAEHIRLSNMAKELKHIPAPTHSEDRKALETATLAHVESILAFALSFYCLDRSVLCRSPKEVPDPGNWVSCHGWYNLVLKRCQPHPHLYGLMAFLGIAYNGTIMRRYTAGYKSDASKLQEAVSGALRCADQASIRLPLALLKSDYPQTWKRGTLSGPPLTKQSATPGRYEGSFSLPIGIHTDPLEAVRLCHAMLTEWCANEKSDYKIRLKLAP